MTLAPDDDFAAAEFALGTLSAGERATLAARRQREPELDAAIRAWEQRLAPLAEAAPPIEPAGDHLVAIQARIRAAPSPAPGQASPDAALLALRRSVARWRIGAIAASILAAALAIGLAAREATREAGPGICRDTAEGRRLAGDPGDGQSRHAGTHGSSGRRSGAARQSLRELWIIDAKLGAPRSLGVIGETARATRLSGYDPAVVESATYAVTVEPPGGSPDGKPSGPPVFTGKLIPVGP